VVDALYDSLIETTIDHGPQEPVDEVQSAWSDELARRVAEVDSGRVTTIPADEAERMIRSTARPQIRIPLAGDPRSVGRIPLVS
jgi:hypothetical protein